jgi:hypothetical protein
VQKDQALYLKAVQKVIASMTLGVDVSPLFSDMIKVTVQHLMVLGGSYLHERAHAMGVAASPLISSRDKWLCICQ